MKKEKAARILLSGFVATLVLTIMLYLASLVGMPNMDVAATLGARLSKQAVAPASGSWWAGMVLHFITGTIVFPFIYVYLLYPVLPGRPWIKGLLWGLILWFIAECLIIPVMAVGTRAAGEVMATLAVAVNLTAHLTYGAMLGAGVGVQKHRRRHKQKQKDIPLEGTQAHQ